MKGYSVWLGHAGKRERTEVEPMQAQVGSKHAQRVERDSAIRRQLAAGHAQHPAATSMEDGFAASARGRTVATGQDAKARVRRPDPLDTQQFRLDSHGRLLEDLGDLGLGRLDLSRLSFVERVRRAE